MDVWKRVTGIFVGDSRLLNFSVLPVIVATFIFYYRRQLYLIWKTLPRDLKWDNLSWNKIFTWNNNYKLQTADNVNFFSEAECGKDGLGGDEGLFSHCQDTVFYFFLSLMKTNHHLINYLISDKKTVENSYYYGTWKRNAL